MSSTVSLISIIPHRSSNQTGDDPGAYTNAEADKSLTFDEQSIRKGFIRKVFLILMASGKCQLLIIYGFVCVFSNSVQQNPALLWIALAVFIVTMIYMARRESVRRKTPQNIIFLFLFTLAESLLLGTIAVQFEADWVLMTVGITAAVALGLALFALQTKWDRPGLVIALFYASLGVTLFSVYLIYDTQLMMDCEHKYSISPKEYIFATLNLYLDIVNLFMYIPNIIGLSRS